MILQLLSLDPRLLAAELGTCDLIRYGTSVEHVRDRDPFVVAVVAVVAAAAAVVEAAAAAAVQLEGALNLEVAVMVDREVL